jgi:hypothetical protein
MKTNKRIRRRTTERRLDTLNYIASVATLSAAGYALLILLFSF